MVCCDCKPGVDKWFPFPGRSSLWPFLHAEKYAFNRAGYDSCDSRDSNEYDHRDDLADTAQSTSSYNSTWTNSSSGTPSSSRDSRESNENDYMHVDDLTDTDQSTLTYESHTSDNSPWRDSSSYSSETECNGPQKGTRLDICSFLSNRGKTTYLVRSNGLPVALADAVLGKYVLICCISMPLFRRSEVTEYLHSLYTAYYELHSHLFEIVFVPKMRPGFDDRDKDYFDSFFSAFHCLAIPFSHGDTRRHICSAFAFRPQVFEIKSILVDPTGCILHQHLTAEYFRDYGGSEWFPFTDSKLDDLEAHDEALKIRLDPFYARQARPYITPQTSAIVAAAGSTPVSLHKDILLCDPSLVLSRIDPAAGNSMTVSALSNKLVALYLCLDGLFMKRLDKIHKRCLAKGQQLEIVLVCLPLLCDPREYHSDLTQALELCNIKSWFVFPALGNMKACRRLWRIFADRLHKDRVIILPPADSKLPGEIEGRAVISKLGFNEYPFIRSIILHRRFNAWFTSFVFPSVNTKVNLPGAPYHNKITSLCEYNRIPFRLVEDGEKKHGDTESLFIHETYNKILHDLSWFEYEY